MSVSILEAEADVADVVAGARDFLSEPRERFDYVELFLIMST